MKNHTPNPFPTSGKMIVVASLLLTIAANGSIIGPWPQAQPHLWNTQPINAPTGYVGGESSVDPPGSLNRLNMPVSTTAAKNVSWLPYPADYAGERMTAARFQMPPGTNVQTIHLKIYDPATIGKHSWAVVLKDSAGRILDFGIRSSYAAAQIKDRQYDGVSWTNSSGFQTRYRGGNDYYTMDFTNNADGTITWNMLYWNPTNTYTANRTTIFTYTNITEIFLNVMTADTTGSGVTYRWTEFSTTPQIPSPPTLKYATAGSDLTFSWLSPWSNFVLQANSDLNTANWTNVTQLPTDDGTNVTTIIPMETGNRFFRLRQ